MSDYPVKSGEHAFITGLVVGSFMKAGLNVVPDIDIDGNYMASMEVTIPPTAVPVTIVVLPPEES